MLRVDVGGATLELLPERAIHLPRLRTLLVADVHVGKATSFRSLGVPVPRGTTAGTLERLSAAVAATSARRLVVLGDFVHARRSFTPQTLQALSHWRTAHPALSITLLRGNHDRRSGDPPPELGIEVVDEPVALGPYRLLHAPREHPEGYVLAGHVHPSIVVGRNGFDRLRLPCFHFGVRVGVLPAFGEFTGSQTRTREPGDRVYAIGAGGVHEV
jgi:DNA ligase-associated metallophosphoesterase